MSDLFTRGGHLSDLTLERLCIGELEVSLVNEHLDQCSICAERLEILRRDTETFKMEHPKFEDRRERSSAIYGAALAMAAAVLLFVSLPNRDHNASGENGPQSPSTWAEPTEHFRVKGSLNVDFFVKRDAKTERLSNGALVFPGDRIGFQVSTPMAGHLMVFGIDDTKEPYLCYPQSNEERSIAFGPTKEMRTLDQAIALDDTLGSEHILAVFCKKPFQFDLLREQLLNTDVTAETIFEVDGQRCRHRRIQLKKTRRDSP